MRNRFLFLSAIVALVLLAPLGAYAEPLAQQNQVQITSPEMNARVRGIVPIMGSATIGSFQFYKVEFGVGPNPSQWAVIGSLHEQPMINGQLEVWDTRALPDGLYTLRLQAVKLDGNWEEFFVRQVAISNSEPTETPTLAVTATPEVAASPTTPYETPTPRATATIQIIAPAVPLSVATPTPTLSRPSQLQTLPVNPKSWLEAFGYGGAAVVVVFVLVGLILGIRRLL